MAVCCQDNRESTSTSDPAFIVQYSCPLRTTPHNLHQRERKNTNM